MEVLLINNIKKTYFLCKKMKEYKKRLQYKAKWSLCKMISYKRRAKYLLKNYNQIYIYGIEFVGIGETLSRLYSYLFDKMQRDNMSYHIVLPIFFPYYKGGIFNRSIFDLFGQYIHFVKEENLFFWLYMFIKYPYRISLDNFAKYERRKVKVFHIKDGSKIIRFSSEKEVYAKEKMSEMGIQKKYICLHAREVTTKTDNFYPYPDTSFADVNINSFRKAYEYIEGLGYQAVRMGKDEKRKCEIEGVIDYANDYYDGFMDFWLIGNCKFLIGCGSGLTSISGFFGCPVLLTNLHVLVDGFEGLPLTKHDLYIPKKFYSKRQNRFLNLYEMLDISNWCGRNNYRFAERGIAVIDNSEEEIKDATIEMNEKMDCVWEETEEERRCMEKYWKIINLWKSRHKTTWECKIHGDEKQGYIMVFMPICYSFLKRNMYLLNVEDDELE